jgi:hypothetical protein
VLFNTSHIWYYSCGLYSRNKIPPSLLTPKAVDVCTDSEIIRTLKLYFHLKIRLLTDHLIWHYHYKIKDYQSNDFQGKYSFVWTYSSGLYSHIK